MVLLYLTEYHTAIKKFLKRDDWYMWANMQKGGITLPMFTSLDVRNEDLKNQS
jgi:mannosidase alpha-like ER degradation enhancer 2